MLNEFRHECKPQWEIERIHRCCPEPPPSRPEPPCNPDCCYDTWTWELTEVNFKLKIVTLELTDEQKHLEVLTKRYNRLKTWRDELKDADDLVHQVCVQLQLIEGQLFAICENSHYTVNAIKTLYCMIREFFYTIDQLQVKYDKIMNCIKCLNYPSLNTTTGIGKVLSDYGTALTAVIQTRSNLLTLLMQVVEGSIQLHDQICYDCGYRQIIRECIDGLNCREHCGKEKEEKKPDEQQQSVFTTPYLTQNPTPNPPAPEGPPSTPGVFCLAPMLTFPICNDSYTLLIDNLYEEEKREVHITTEEVTKLNKKQQALLAVQASLVKALKEVTPPTPAATA